MAAIASINEAGGFNVNRRVLAVVMMVLLGSGTSRLRAEDPIEDLLSATFRIADRDRSGTCFLVQSTVEGKPPLLALVTAAHVLEQMGPEGEWIARSELPEGQFARTVVKVKLREGDKPLWKRHPELDIAALKVDKPEGLAAKPFSLDQLADEQRVKDRHVRVGQEAWIPCYPAKLEANDSGWPVLRRGSIASYPLTPAAKAKTMLIDYSAFGGDSGAPVVVVQEGRPLVAGLVLGMHRQTDRAVLPFEERIMHTPLGISMAVQASFVRETIALLQME
jgi:hypothetical protein